MEGLTLVTGPSTQPIGMAAVKDHLYIVDTDTSREAYLIEIQDSAVDQFQSEAEYQVMTATYKLTLSEFPCDYIDIPMIPVSSITTFLYYTDKTNTDTLVLDTDFYLVTSDRSAKLFPVSSWPSAGDRPDAVQITFVAGHARKQDVPKRLIHGLKFLIGHYNENRQNVVVGPNVQKIPQSYEAIVDKFKRYQF